MLGTSNFTARLWTRSWVSPVPMIMPLFPSWPSTERVSRILWAYLWLAKRNVALYLGGPGFNIDWRQGGLGFLVGFVRPTTHVIGRSTRTGVDRLIAHHFKVNTQWTLHYSRFEARTAILKKIQSSGTLSSVQWHIFTDVSGKFSDALFMTLQTNVFRLLDRANCNVYLPHSRKLGVYERIASQGIFKKYDRRMWSKLMWIRVRKAGGELHHLGISTWFTSLYF
jgi:hypothetical protein